MSFPSTPILDNFNRANEGPPPSSKWLTVDANGFKVLSNVASANAAGSDNAWGTQFGPDCECYFTITTKPATAESMQAVARANSAFTNAYVVYLLVSAGTDSIKLSKIVNNSETNLAIYSQEVSANDGIGISCVGTKISAYYRSGLAGAWTFLGSVSDAALPGRGYIGVYTDTSGAAFDDFGGGSLFKYRKTFSSIGTRTCTRQLQRGSV